ncbi:MAG: insulinase family protein [Desulfamplus sp.]|nr:insulinase family protein [Desulfamplus sp.]
MSNHDTQSCPDCAAGSGNGKATVNIKDKISGYEVLRIEPLEEIKSTFYELKHTATNARHIHIANQDSENTFGVTFRTVPEDSTGVAHILEHTVLCGSEKYHVRDPFFSMLKRSLSTFMNALTASDWTMYPFSTPNEKDYYNLMDVYLDAAFFPRLDELSFKQEGHRMELVPVRASENCEGGEQRELDLKGELKLEYKGVVYNEMKGAMSSPSQIMGRALMKALYPDTTYSCNSGGEPSDIPTLTHKDLKDFHARYYHPSNAFFYTYGSLPMERHLDFIEKKVMSRFQAIQTDSEVSSQPRWNTPGEMTVPYPLSGDENPEKKYQACLAWLTADIRDPFETLVLGVLEHVLLGNAASPLRKTLIDSGLGSALSDASGFDGDLRDTMFACGLKDIKKEDAGKVGQLTMECLESIVKKGLDPQLLESAIHQIEFHKKEITNTPHPFGIKLLLSFAGTWIHEGDPLSCLNFDQDIQRLRDETAKGPFLEEKIRQYFLDNPHRVLFILEPDQEMESRENQRVEKELKDKLASLTPQDIEAIMEDARKLREIQESQEDVTALPTLELTDIKPDIEIISPDKIDYAHELDSAHEIKGIPHAVCYEKPTSDILYFTCPAGLATLLDQHMPLIPFFCRAFTGAGTALRDYTDMAELMDLYTGGIGISPYIGTGFNGNDEYISFLSLQGKALGRNIDPMFNIIKELISDYSFKNLTRLRNLLLQYRASMESSIVANGHRYAISLASRNLGPTSAQSELWHGITQFRYIRELTEEPGMSNIPGSAGTEAVAGECPALDQLSQSLDAIAQSLFFRENMKPGMAGDRDALIKANKNIGAIMNALAAGQNSDFRKNQENETGDYPHEGWTTSTSVSFVAQSFKTVRMGHDHAPAMAAMAKMLRALYLHREIREKGGAYGGFAMYNPEEGIFSFASYRDPNIRRTLRVFDDACRFIMDGSYTEEDVKEAVLQVCSEIDKPETPGPASIKAFYRDILGLTDEKRRNFKEALLGLNKKNIMAAAGQYFAVDAKESAKESAKEKGTAVISSREAIDAANRDIASGERELMTMKI